MTVSTDRRVGWVPRDTLANRLILVRSTKRMSQRAAAESAGLTFGEWQGMELGRGTRRLDVKVKQIAMSFGVDKNWLMWGGDLESEDPGPDGGVSEGSPETGTADYESDELPPIIGSPDLFDADVAVAA